MKMGNDLTRGPVAKTLLRFATPYLIANLLNTLYGIVDMFIVGRFASSMELSAVSIGAMVMMMINFLLMGLATGGTVIVGNFAGAKKDKELRETVSTVFCILPLAAIIIMAVLMFLREPLLVLINTPEEAFAGAKAYVSICLVGMVFSGFYNAIASVYRGIGESKTPMIFVGISCVLNIIGDIVCVAWLNMGAAGAALATTASQAVSVIIGYIYIKRNKNFPFDFRPSSFRIYKERARRIFSLGLPAAGQELLVNASFIVLEAVVNKLGYVSTAAAGVADRIFGMAVIPAGAFFGAVAAMVAQNQGAGRPDRSHKCMWVGVLVSGGLGILLWVVMAIVPAAVISIFTPDKEVIAAGVEYMVFFKYDFLLFAFSFPVLGYINGMGHTKYTLLVNIVSAVIVRLPLVYFFSTIPGATLYHIGMALPLASLVQLFMAYAYLLLAKGERQYRRDRLPSQL